MPEAVEEVVVVQENPPVALTISFPSAVEGGEFARKAAGRVTFDEPPVRPWGSQYLVVCFADRNGIADLVEETGGRIL